jgi:hypothetical protein
MWKAYVPLNIIAYLGFMIYYHYTKRYDLKKNWKVLIYIPIIIFLLVSPTLIYNYSNYKHNNDIVFYQKFKLNPG